MSYSTTIPKITSSAPKCPRCGKSVYHAERVTGPGGDWHKRCLLCKACNKSLEAGSYAERENEVYCKACYGKKFGPKGIRGGAHGGVVQTE